MQYMRDRMKKQPGNAGCLMHKGIARGTQSTPSASRSCCSSFAFSASSIFSWRASFLKCGVDTSQRDMASYFVDFVSYRSSLALV